MTIKTDLNRFKDWNTYESTMWDECVMNQNPYRWETVIKYLLKKQKPQKLIPLYKKKYIETYHSFEVQGLQKINLFKKKMICLNNK